MKIDDQSSEEMFIKIVQHLRNTEYESHARLPSRQITASANGAWVRAETHLDTYCRLSNGDLLSSQHDRHTHMLACTRTGSASDYNTNMA